MRYPVFLILIAVLLTGCSNSTSTDNNEFEDTSSVMSFETEEEYGASTLTRTDSGVSFNLTTSNLTPGEAYTIWMVIFNQPQNCDAPGCGEADLANPDVEVDLVFAGDGLVIGSSGEATFTGSRDINQEGNGSVMGKWLDLPENGLIDPLGAEIHFILRSHGPVIEELEDEMISTFNAGCGPDAMEGAPPVPESLGTHGPNTCVDEQFAVHTPEE